MLQLNSAVYFLLLCAVSAAATDFDFGTLTLTSLKLIGDAHLRNTTVCLTRDLPVPNSGSGRVLYSSPVRFRRPGPGPPASFSTFFSFSITNLNPSSIGGGLAFLLSPDAESAGSAGGFLGLSIPSPSSFFAVEFDTLMDVGFHDLNGNHVGVDLTGMVSAQSADLGAIEVDLKSGDLINSWIEFNGVTRRLNVSVSYSNLKPNLPLISMDLDLEQYVNDFMFVGFSASTQGSTESHNVEWWSFTSSFEETTSTATPIAPPLVNESADSTPQSLPPAAHAPNRGTNATPPPNRGSWKAPGAIAAGAVCFAAFAAGILYAAFVKKSRLRKSELVASEIIKMPKEFGYKELRAATKRFDSSRVIGQGAFGTVYKGVLPETGGHVAVKRCSHTTQGKTEFLSELSIIGTLRHRNLVRLQGWCHEKGEILLVYDLMPNGSLDKALFESRIVLNWAHRKKVLMGVASALAYLHEECENQVIHRDVKTSNVMLDEGFGARLGDFGLARQIEHDKSPDATVAAGTMGYLAPEYMLTGRATDKTDVFSFGAVVLEVASGRRPIEKDRGNGYNLVDWVWGLEREGRVVEAADQRLGGEFDEAEMRRVLMVGLVCSHSDPGVRPTMRGAIGMLTGEAEVPLVERAVTTSLSFSTSQLLESLQDTVSDCNALLTLSTSSSCSSLEQRLMGEDLV